MLRVLVSERYGEEYLAGFNRWCDVCEAEGVDVQEFEPADAKEESELIRFECASSPADPRLHTDVQETDALALQGGLERPLVLSVVSLLCHDM